MSRRLSHPVFAWLCLIWFGLTNTAFAGGMMVCNDGHGGSRVEWSGCERNADGECVVSCGSDPDGDPGVPHPCEDTPIPGQEQIIKAPPRSAGETSVPVPVLMAVLVLGGWADPPLAAQAAWTAFEPDRPPDILRHIRTVVLLV
jgi:hypothetical protein